MFACHVCEGTEYELINGQYFCKTCNTLSEEHHEQDVQEDLIGNLGSQARKVKSSTIIGKSINCDLGRPWTIYEAYQCIILAQCEALISLGAKHDLKDIVYTMWANFLSKMQIAFNKEEKVIPDLVKNTGFGRHRELYGGTLEQPLNRPKKRRHPDSSDSSSDENSRRFIIGNKQKTWVKKSPQWMDLKKTVAFIYIGLRYTNPEILLVQLVRWIYEGRVPFMSTTHLLNSDMPLSVGDMYLFMPSPITVQTMIEEMNKITRFLSMRIFPTPNVKAMIKELVTRLHLPENQLGLSSTNALMTFNRLELITKNNLDVFHTVNNFELKLNDESGVIYSMSCYELKNECLRTFHKVPSDVRSNTFYPETEFVAIQYIALTLKRIFGLDDKTEHQLSKYSEEVQKIIGSERSLFVWNTWVSYQMGKEKTDFDLYRDFTRGWNFKHLHLDEILKCYSNFQRENRRLTTQSDENHQQKLSVHKTKITTGATASIKTEKDPCDVSSQADKALQERFEKSLLTHIVDFNAFRTHLKDYLDENCLKNLKHQRNKVDKYLDYKRHSLVNEEESSRHHSNSYIWLLQFLSDFVGYQVFNLEKGIVSLETRLRMIDQL